MHITLAAHENGTCRWLFCWEKRTAPINEQGAFVFVSALLQVQLHTNGPVARFMIMRAAAAFVVFQTDVDFAGQTRLRPVRRRGFNRRPSRRLRLKCGRVERYVVNFDCRKRSRFSCFSSISRMAAFI